MRTQLMTAIAAAFAIAPAFGQDIVINEIRIDDPGSDNAEYFELKGEPGASLDGLFYITIGDSSAGSGAVEEVTDLVGQVIPASGYFLCANTSYNLAAVPDFVNSLSFENSDNVTHLLVRDFTGSSGDDLDVDDDGVLDSTPWSAELDRIALNETLETPPPFTEFNYGPPSAGPDGSFVPGHIFREDDSTGPLVHWAVGIFDETAGLDTPGAANAGAGRLPASFGGAAGLALDFGPSAAGSPYLVLATLSGTAPGTPVGVGQVLPLNIDALFNLSLSQANSANFVDTFGTLDANGQGFAQIVLPGGLDSLAGQTLDVAALTIDPFTLGVNAISNNGTVNLD